jgi:hypothetical protein
MAIGSKMPMAKAIVDAPPTPLLSLSAGVFGDLLQRYHFIHSFTKLKHPERPAFQSSLE